MEEQNIPIYKITVPITKTELVLSVSGDWHYGVAGVNASDIIDDAVQEQDQHRGNIFRIYTGDLFENNLNNSVGHGYDIAIRDPHIQKTDVRDALIAAQKHLYGPAFKRIRADGDLRGILSAGVIGNHEYRTRNTSGQWVQEEIYGPAKVLDMKVSGILELNIVNHKLKISKLYRIFVSHRPNKSNATSIESILRSMKKRKADVPADVYIFGHYHRRVIYPDGTYNEQGEFKKILYVVNPSPITYMEYADWSGFSPLTSGWHVNVYLPLDKHSFPYGKV